MVTRFDKSSITRGPDYMLIYRLKLAIGPRVVERALQGDLRAIERLDAFAWRGRKKPAVVRLVAQLKGVAQHANKEPSF